MPYLIKIGFGPVHGFITAARKLEDLCSGSCMLSDLMKEAAGKLGDKLIYPVLPANRSKANMPNVMVLKTDSEPSELAKQIIDDIKQDFYDQIAAAVKSQKLSIDNDLLNTVIARQTSGFLETVWSAVELGSSFENSLIKLNQRFDAAKRTRMFYQQEEPGMKCTLQTNLSALAPQPPSDKNPDQFTKDWWLKLSRKCIRDHEGRELRNASKLARKGERFSAIGLAKRVKARTDEDTHHFPSTCAVATAMWRKRIIEKSENDDFKADVFEAFFDKWSDLKKSDDIEFNEVTRDVIPALSEMKKGCNLPDDIFEKLLTCEAQCFRKTDFANENIKENKNTQSDPIAEERRDLTDYTEEIGAGTPPGHYALLSADGDSMGRFVDACKNEQSLRILSNALKDFSEQAFATIEGENVCGRIIYAGGDDVLAVMPVDTAINAACELRRIYREKLGGITYTDEDNHPIKATLSVALLFAPDSYPLHRLLDNAEVTLNGKAKAEEKDALAITVYKGGSEVSATVLPTETSGWKLNEWIDGNVKDVSEDDDKKLPGMRDLFDTKKISSKSMHDLLRDLSIMEKGDSNDPELIKSIVMGRIATNRATKDEEIKQVQERLNEFYEAIDAENTLRNRGDITPIGNNDRTDFRNNAPTFIASTLITLRNIWRMQCL
ncbi:type III-B CRISPR-associated protein Cas10/Cmr2 [Desulfovibrio gilichinskyi]|uniref:CRISPR-associated protein Cmr2 n=1 Tax=Desulfovibrio gilichinskyi TaxID=1519643 RepID=A0A1X7D6K0_9BACT|nr:type III-B CRISPR-associated protein Cas10/Cmr2 [Desulfovibrio gilichinskyi]SMF09877.1 CRISPR-associated protein Cmr2 [Desulfovibrio gilichinskyi]